LLLLPSYKPPRKFVPIALHLLGDKCPRKPTFVGIKPFRKPTFFFLVTIVVESSRFLVMTMQKNLHPMLD
jgi:hypothetical protein